MASFVSPRSLDFISFVTSVTWMFGFGFEFVLVLVLVFLNVLLVVLLVLDDENDEG